ncbi:MAG: hypothetical protein WA718_12965 [Terriglobales bacterium]
MSRIVHQQQVNPPRLLDHSTEVRSLSQVEAGVQFDGHFALVLLALKLNYV